MLIRYSDWKKPTDAAFAFPLKAAPREFTPVVPAPGSCSDIRSVAREVLDEEAASRFEHNTHRWSGPENVVGPAGERPYEGQQVLFEEVAWRSALCMDDLEAVLCGRVLVFRHASGQTDFILRDHHMIDVALYQYRATGELPGGLFHADRHSDYCRDGFLEKRRPDQAATWWKLFEGLKRPVEGAPVLAEEQVFFAHVKAPHEPWMSGRELEGALVMPWFLSPAELGWQQVLAREGATSADWISLDLDYFQPSPQLALSKGLLRDARFHAMLDAARVRVFVLSPQFTNGGDRIASWEVQGRMHSSLRLLNLLRNLTTKIRPDSPA